MMLVSCAAGMIIFVLNLLLSPLVLAANLLLLLRSEIVLDVEGLADLLGRLALDHICDSLATNVKKSLDIEEVCSLGVSY